MQHKYSFVIIKKCDPATHECQELFVMAIHDVSLDRLDRAVTDKTFLNFRLTIIGDIVLLTIIKLTYLSSNIFYRSCRSVYRYSPFLLTKCHPLSLHPRYRLLCHCLLYSFIHVLLALPIALFPTLTLFLLVCLPHSNQVPIPSELLFLNSALHTTNFQFPLDFPYFVYSSYLCLLFFFNIFIS